MGTQEAAFLIGLAGIGNLFVLTCPARLTYHRGMAPPLVHTIVIDDAAAGQRLDRALHLLLPELSRTRLKGLLEAGSVTLDGTGWRDAARKVLAGQVFTVTVPEAHEATPRGEDLPLTILFEDDDMLVIDKAAGMTVHPAPGSPDHTLVNALIAHCGASLSGIGGVRRPGIVHRLDKNTSGLMVAAKNDLAHAALSAQLADRSLSRKYLAVVWGRPVPPTGSIDKPIARSSSDRKKMAVAASGRPSVTDYAVLHAIGLQASLVRCQLQTGRTHQIRVHMASIGHPLVGDPVYGRRMTGKLRKEAPALADFPRQALHAAEIGFIHPRSLEPMRFESEIPQDIATLIVQSSEPIGT